MANGHSQEDAFGAPAVEPGAPTRRYFFDVHDGAVSVTDEEGTELDDLEAAGIEAARLLVELAKGRLPGARRRELMVYVRDGSGPVLRTTLVFAVEPLVH